MIIREAKFLRSVTRPDQAPPPPRPSVAFAGRSNCGKSSLINSVLSAKGLARTSSTPGRTQEIIIFGVNDRFYFIDLPGYGFAKAPERIRAKWGPMVEGFLTGYEPLRLVVVILDARRDPSPEDLQLIEWLRSVGIAHLCVATKTDKLGKSELRRRLNEIAAAVGEEPSRLIPFSAIDGTGKREVLRELVAALQAKNKAAEPDEE